MLAEFWQIPTLGILSQSNTNLPQGSTEQPISTSTSLQPTTTTTTSVVPTHRWGHTNKVANGVTELCGLWSKNIHSTWYQQFKGFAARKGVVAPGFPRVSKTRYVSYDNMAHIILHNSSLIGDFLNEYSGSEVCNTSREVLVRLGDPYVLQVMNIMSRSLEGFSLPYMKEMATIQDLDSYKEVFAKWESHLRDLYRKPSSLAMFFGRVNVGKKGTHEASAQLQGQRRGRRNQAAFTPEALPSDDFQSQVRQPLWHCFGFGSLPLVAVNLCV